MAAATWQQIYRQENTVRSPAIEIEACLGDAHRLACRRLILQFGNNRGDVEATITAAVRTGHHVPFKLYFTNFALLHVWDGNARGRETSCFAFTLQ